MHCMCQFAFWGKHPVSEYKHWISFMVTNTWNKLVGCQLKIMANNLKWDVYIMYRLCFTYLHKQTRINCIGMLNTLSATIFRLLKSWHFNHVNSHYTTQEIQYSDAQQDCGILARYNLMTWSNCLWNSVKKKDAVHLHTPQLSQRAEALVQFLLEFTSCGWIQL